MPRMRYKNERGGDGRGKRDLRPGWYEPPVCARRHLAKPLNEYCQTSTMVEYHNRQIFYTPEHWPSNGSAGIARIEIRGWSNGRGRHTKRRPDRGRQVRRYIERCSSTNLVPLSIKEAVARASRSSKDSIQECIMGIVLSAGIGQNPARQAAIAAGLPIEESAIERQVNLRFRDEVRDVGGQLHKGRGA